MITEISAQAAAPVTPGVILHLPDAVARNLRDFIGHTSLGERTDFFQEQVGEEYVNACEAACKLGDVFRTLDKVLRPIS